MAEIVYLNGVLIPTSEAKISAFDYGFLYGYGIFETMRAYDGTVFRLDKHLERLKKSAYRLGIAVMSATLKKAVVDTLAANALKDARIRLAVSSGAGNIVPNPASCGEPTILASAVKYDAGHDEINRRGYRINVSSFRRNSRSAIIAMKTANYLENLLARQEAKAAGVDDVFFLNDTDFVTEASTSNIFLVTEGILKTPRLENGILPGITREVVIELAVQNKIIIQEADIGLGELLAADEVFVTNSIMEIVPITALNGGPIGGSNAGNITQRLIRAYKDVVIRETSR